MASYWLTDALMSNVHIFPFPLRRPPIVALVFGGSVILLTLAVIFTLHDKADSARREADLITSITVDANHLSEIEWQAISEKGLSPSLAADTRATQSRITAALNRLAENGGEQDIAVAYGEYQAAMNMEVAALARNDVELALQIDEDRTDLAFGVLSEEANGEIASHRAVAARWSQVLFAGSAAAVIVAGLLTALAVAWSQRAVRFLNRHLESIVAERTSNLEGANRELSALYKEAEARAATDNLTGLLNHRRLHEQAAEFVARARDEAGSVTLIVLDIDGFKRINDTLGHEAGDRVLKTIANILRKIAGDAPLFRHGGDDFAVLLQGVGGEDAATLAECIRAAINVTSFETHVTASLGVATFPVAVNSAEELIHGAGAAMNWAKNGGHNRVVRWCEMVRLRAAGQLPWYTADTAIDSPEVVTALVSALEAKDPQTRSHTERCSQYSLEIAGGMGLDEEQQSIVRLTSLLHDVGKIHIRDDVLFKPGPLDEQEWQHMQEHSGIGQQIVGQVRSLTEVASAILHHHEHFDGSGYPEGLRGEEIPIASRILMVSDAFDAMTVDRPYRKAMPVSTAIGELKREAGTQFDPRVVEVFLDVIERLGLPHSQDAHTPDESRGGAPAAPAWLSR